MLKPKLHLYPVLPIITYSIITKSTVQAKMLDRQYTHIACGTLYEERYYGNWVNREKKTHAENVIM